MNLTLKTLSFALLASASVNLFAADAAPAAAPAADKSAGPNPAKQAIAVRKAAYTLIGNSFKPIGAVMVVVLLLTILIQAITGLFTNDEILNVGPLYAYIIDELSLKLTSLHRQLFYWILAAVLLHIAAVLVHVFFKRDNIVKAMFTGKNQRRV